MCCSLGGPNPYHPVLQLAQHEHVSLHLAAPVDSEGSMLQSPKTSPFALALEASRLVTTLRSIRRATERSGGIRGGTERVPFETDAFGVIVTETKIPSGWILLVALSQSDASRGVPRVSEQNGTGFGTFWCMGRIPLESGSTYVKTQCSES